MFNFFQKPAQPAPVQQEVKEQMPEGCELLADCDFAEITGGSTTSFRPVNL